MDLQEKVQALAGTLGTRGWKEVIVPALERALSNTMEAWVNQVQPKGQELTDEALRQRIIVLRWVLDWNKNYKLLAEQLDAVDNMRRETVPAQEGGSPYE